MCRGGNRCPTECCGPRRGSARSRLLHRPSAPSVHPPPSQIRVCPVPLHSVWLESNTEELVPPRTAWRRQARVEIVSWKHILLHSCSSSFDGGHAAPEREISGIAVYRGRAASRVSKRDPARMRANMGVGGTA